MYFLCKWDLAFQSLSSPPLNSTWLWHYTIRYCQIPAVLWGCGWSKLLYQKRYVFPTRRKQLTLPRVLTVVLHVQYFCYLNCCLQELIQNSDFGEMTKEVCVLSSKSLDIVRSKFSTLSAFLNCIRTYISFIHSSNSCSLALVPRWKYAPSNS